MKIWLCVVSMLLCVQAAWAQAPAEAPGLPQNDPAYADLAIVYDSALIECCYGCNGKFVPLTRYEFAVGIARLIQNVTLIRASQTRFTDKDRRLNNALARLLVQFTPELHELGISSSDLNIAYTTLTGERGSIKNYIVSPPFRDVTPDHWAFNAVELLRLNGVVVGQSPPLRDVSLTNNTPQQGLQK